MTGKSYSQVHKRSAGRCEAIEEFVGGKVGRCFGKATEVHHMLTRSRGGKILDNYGETEHLIHLCGRHHRQAHGPDGRELMIDGYVTTGPDGKPQYTGTHQGLRDKYGVPDERAV